MPCTRSTGVTHLVVEHDDYRRDLRRQKIYVQPYNDFIFDQLVAGRRTFLLADPPQDAVVFRSDKYMVVELPLADPSRESR